MMKAICPVCKSGFDSQRPRVALNPNPAPWYSLQRTEIFCPECEHPLQLSSRAKCVTRLAFITSLIGILVGTAFFGFGDTFIGTMVTVASITVPFSIGKVLLGRTPYMSADKPNKDFNRTPERSGPAKPGKPRGGTG